MNSEIPIEEDVVIEFKWIDNITRLMDSSFRLPGTSFQFGIDPIIGLIPFAGNIITYIITSVLILAMVRHGVSGRVVGLMVLNVALDFVIGVVPVIGTIFDATYKANTRNLKLLKAHYQKDKYEGSFWGVIGAVLLVLVLTLVLVAFLAVKLLTWLFSLI